MRFLKAFIGILGIGVLVGGIVVAGDTGLADQAVEALGNDYLVVAVPAVLAVVLVVLGLLFRAVSGISQADPPDPEGIPTVPQFGGEFDDYTSGAAVNVGGPGSVFGDSSTKMHDRVREAAIRTEMRSSGITREAATKRIDEGGWTDDRDAAAFCKPNGATGGPLKGRLRAAIRGRTWAQYGAARAAESLITRSDRATRPAMNDGGREPGDQR